MLNYNGVQMHKKGQFSKAHSKQNIKRDNKIKATYLLSCVVTCE